MNTTASNELNAKARSNDRDSQVTDTLASKAHETVDRVANGARHAERDVRAGVDKLADTARTSEARARETVDAGVDKTSAYVRENPLLSAGLAFAAGVVLSSLLRR